MGFPPRSSIVWKLRRLSASSFLVKTIVGNQPQANACACIFTCDDDCIENENQV